MDIRSMHRANLRGLLTDKADMVYSDSRLVFYQDEYGSYYVSRIGGSNVELIGSIESVNDYLESLL